MSTLNKVENDEEKYELKNQKFHKWEVYEKHWQQ